MNVIPDWRAADDLQIAVAQTAEAGQAGAAEAAPEVIGGPGAAEAPPPEPAGAREEPARAQDLIAGIAASVRELAESAQRYHARAEQRETVIDHLHAEVDRLRQGERRGLLRPLLVEICRLRNDLLGQAGELPEDFDRERAVLLLRSYAESVELALENSGVVTFAPDSGDAFDPRMHRRIAGEPTPDPGRTGRIAAVRRDGYLDVDANSPIAPAEVVVFTASAESRQDRTEEQ